MTSSVIYFKISQFHSLIVDFYIVTHIGIDFELFFSSHVTCLTCGCNTVVYPSAGSCKFLASLVFSIIIFVLSKNAMLDL